MRVKLDMKDSAKQLAPDGEYQLRFKKKSIGKKAGKQFDRIEIDWEPFNPPNGVSMDQIDRCIIRDWVSLAPNALFTLKNLAAACDVSINCANCNTEYQATEDKCPDCQSFEFEIDLDFIDTATPWAFIQITKDVSGTRDVNKVVKYAAVKS